MHWHGDSLGSLSAARSRARLGMLVLVLVLAQWCWRCAVLCCAWWWWCWLANLWQWWLFCGFPSFQIGINAPRDAQQCAVTPQLAALPADRRAWRAQSSVLAPFRCSVLPPILSHPIPHPSPRIVLYIAPGTHAPGLPKVQSLPAPASDWPSTPPTPTACLHRQDLNSHSSSITDACACSSTRTTPTCQRSSEARRYSSCALAHGGST